jgi:hypothetical protein
MMDDEILNQIAIHQVLAELPDADRLTMELHYRLTQPEDYGLRWPPRFEDIGVYIGLRFRGYPLSEATIRYRVSAIQARWRGERGELRPYPHRRDLHQGLTRRISGKKRKRSRRNRGRRRGSRDI